MTLLNNCNPATVSANAKRARIIEMLKQGKTTAEIIAETNSHQRTVQKVRKHLLQKKRMLDNGSLA